MGGKGTLLDAESVIWGSHHPLVKALGNYLTFNRRGVYTFVLDGEGFIQGRDRASGLACDIVYIAPSWDESSEGIWYRLLEGLCVEKGEERARRIFVKLREEESEEVEVFRQVGFRGYARRQIFRGDETSPKILGADKGSLRPRRAGDEWGLQRLYGSVTPRPVQQVERPEDTPLYPMMREYVAEEEGEIIAYFCLVPGKEGHWMKAVIHPQAEKRLVRSGLRLFSALKALPIYCEARGYEQGLRSALREIGFGYLFEELLMVKHTTARAKVPAAQPAVSLEKKAEGVPTISSSKR
ncbi:MAG: hypothetical protein WBH57_10525 [Anaerolineae bacterium]